MRRNYASLDLTALSATDDATDEPDAVLVDESLCEQQASSAVAQLSLDDGFPYASSCTIGFPIEMVPSASDRDSAPKPATDSRARSTSPPTPMPPKTSVAGGLPSIRPSPNDPVRRSGGDFSSSPSSFSSKSKLSMSTSTTTPMVMRSNLSDCVPANPKPLVPIHRNVIQSV